jgi:aminodeoxychorismate synthase component I
MIKFIEKHGTPDAVFFSFEKRKHYAVWGFDDVYSISRDELNNENILNDLQDKIDGWKSTSSEIAAVGFLSYDAKNIFFPHLRFNSLQSESPILWFGKPTIIKMIAENELRDMRKNVLSLKKLKNLHDGDHYHIKINEIKKYLRSGDVYQINYTQPMQYSFQGTPFELYLALLPYANPKFGAYLDINSQQFISMSPENFFTRVDDDISSSPIKGTRKRSPDKEEDHGLMIELMNSEKDRAEHIMIVDLIRNDLGKICEFGSINTKDLFGVKSFKTIHHMVTEVIGKLKPNTREIDIFKALFPGGSITGAPKQRAIEIIDEIEKYSRGIYTGSMGVISNTGDMIFNIAIRTLILKNNLIKYPVGGGIVWDSDPDEERMEAIQKSKILSI